METVVEIFILEEYPEISSYFLNHLYLMNNFRLYFLLFSLFSMCCIYTQTFGKTIYEKRGPTCVCVIVSAAYSRSLG